MVASYLSWRIGKTRFSFRLEGNALSFPSPKRVPQCGQATGAGEAAPSTRGAWRVSAPGFPCPAWVETTGASFRTEVRCLVAGLLLWALSLDPGASELPPCCRELKPDAVFTDRSLYQLDSEWTSDVGRKVKLGVFAGRPQVVAMFFTHCEYACPIIVNDLKRIEAALPETLRNRVDFLLISFDTARDTPEVLRSYRESRKLPAARWSLLRGEGDDVRELAALLGVNYRQDERGQFAHSNVITLLNARGEVVRQLTGLNQDVAAFVQTIEMRPGD